MGYFLAAMVAAFAFFVGPPRTACALCTRRQHPQIPQGPRPRHDRCLPQPLPPKLCRRVRAALWRFLALRSRRRRRRAAQAGVSRSLHSASSSALSAWEPTAKSARWSSSPLTRATTSAHQRLRYHRLAALPGAGDGSLRPCSGRACASQLNRKSRLAWSPRSTAAAPTARWRCPRGLRRWASPPISRPAFCSPK